MVELKLEGKIEITEIEYGFYPPLISIGGKSLQDAIIETFYPDYKSDRWSLPNSPNTLDDDLPRIIGKASITIKGDD